MLWTTAESGSLCQATKRSLLNNSLETEGLILRIHEDQEPNINHMNFEDPSLMKLTKTSDLVGIVPATYKRPFKLSGICYTVQELINHDYVKVYISNTWVCF